MLPFYEKLSIVNVCQARPLAQQTTHFIEREKTISKVDRTYMSRAVLS
jgi:hypothetical protein